MAEHKYAQVLRWVASGERIVHQGACKSHQTVLTLVASGYFAPEEFRIAPKTIKIGTREVEAPVGDLENRESVWCWDSDYCRPCEQLADGSVAQDQLKYGLCFATREACQAAHDAIHALLRGEAC